MLDFYTVAVLIFIATNITITVFLGVLVFDKKYGDGQIIVEKTAKITELSNELDEEKLRSKAALQLYDESQLKLKLAEMKIAEFLGILKDPNSKLKLGDK